MWRIAHPSHSRMMISPMAGDPAPHRAEPRRRALRPDGLAAALTLPPRPRLRPCLGSGLAQLGEGLAPRRLGTLVRAVHMPRCAERLVELAAAMPTFIDGAVGEPWCLNRPAVVAPLLLAFLI